MARLETYHAIFKTHDNKYYSRVIPTQETSSHNAEVAAKKLGIKDEFVSVGHSDEDQFL